MDCQGQETGYPVNAQALRNVYLLIFAVKHCKGCARCSNCAKGSYGKHENFELFTNVNTKVYGCLACLVPDTVVEPSCRQGEGFFEIIKIDEED